MTIQTLPSEADFRADPVAAFTASSGVAAELITDLLIATLANDGPEVYRLIPDELAQRIDAGSAPGAVLYALGMTADELADWIAGPLTMDAAVTVARDGSGLAFTFRRPGGRAARFGIFQEGQRLRVLPSPDIDHPLKGRIRRALRLGPPRA